jgi:phosphoglycolate phosphatase
MPHKCALSRESTLTWESHMPYRLVAFDFDGTLADSFGWFVNAMGPVADRYRFRRADPADMEMLRGLSGHELLKYLRLAKWKLPIVAAHVRRLCGMSWKGMKKLRRNR